ncbi:MAG: hypothetical protein JWP74_1762 [Marmoricola sp.]|nr:hypothetical protein [Marmoricola sp.]
MATPQEHAVAVGVLLNTLLSPKFAYDFDKVPSPRPTEYVDYAVTRRFGGEVREDGFTGTTGWRVTVRYVAKTIPNARLLQNKVTAGLEYASLSIAGDSTTPVLFETSEPIGTDEDGYFTGLDAFTYTI